mmetsp:Transcript_41177/g.96587  ORF Transcript_41177/g.96587 Transcript_41177/m.96587 type:complete len:304 (-) Transcript_41177:120-1031(-)
MRISAITTYSLLFCVSVGVTSALITPVSLIPFERHHFSRHPRFGRRRTAIAGYKFGDISRSIGTKIAKLSGKEEYEFGDLSRWIDAKAKEKVSELTEKEEYEFGDLSRWVDSRIKSAASEFTNKDEYQFGDVTKEIASRVSKGDYTLDDLMTLFKILLTFGVGLSPVSSILPVKLLVEMLNYSIAQDVGGRLASALAMEIDRRFKDVVTGDPEYKFGDLTVRAINKFTGKGQYDFGDITRTVVSMIEEEGQLENQSERGVGNKVLFGNVSDRKLENNSEQNSILDAEVLSELASWEEKATNKQ